MASGWTGSTSADATADRGTVVTQMGARHVAASEMSVARRVQSGARDQGTNSPSAQDPYSKRLTGSKTVTMSPSQSWDMGVIVASDRP